MWVSNAKILPSTLPLHCMGLLARVSPTSPRREGRHILFSFPSPSVIADVAATRRRSLCTAVYALARATNFPDAAAAAIISQPQ